MHNHRNLRSPAGHISKRAIGEQWPTYPNLRIRPENGPTWDIPTSAVVENLEETVANIASSTWGLQLNPEEVEMFCKSLDRSCSGMPAGMNTIKRLLANWLLDRNFQTTDFSESKSVGIAPEAA